MGVTWSQVSFLGAATPDCSGSGDHSFPEESWFRQEAAAVKAVALLRLESPAHCQDDHFELQEVFGLVCLHRSRHLSCWAWMRLAQAQAPSSQKRDAELAALDARAAGLLAVERWMQQGAWRASLTT